MQLGLEEKSKELTTINTHRGLYRYNKLCFGISSAPAIFQRTMDQLLGKIPNIVVFLDDILIGGPSREEHEKTLRTVLKILNDAGLKLKKEKWVWFANKVTYLGFNVDSQGVTPTKDKLKAIFKAPAPKDVKQL